MEDYPREVTIGDSVPITMGVTNREGSPRWYRVEIWNGDEIIEQVDHMLLQNGQTVELPIRFVPTEIGEDVEISFLLFIVDQPEPYRSLQLWMAVKAAE